MSIGYELEKLKQLLDVGVLSKSEFEVAKSKLYKLRKVFCFSD